MPTDSPRNLGELLKARLYPQGETMRSLYSIVAVAHNGQRVYFTNAALHDIRNHPNFNKVEFIRALRIKYDLGLAEAMDIAEAAMAAAQTLPQSEPLAFYTNLVETLTTSD